VVKLKLSDKPGKVLFKISRNKINNFDTRQKEISKQQRLEIRKKRHITGRKYQVYKTRQQ